MILKFTKDDFDIVETEIKNSQRYGYDIDARILKAYPDNNDEQIVAMKIALIDMLNSTHLSLHLGKISLKEIIEKLMDTTTDFDNRCKKGELSLVSELIEWSINKGVNLFSFFSKYCVFHNYYVYNRDDFVIYDAVLRKHLGDYISKTDYQALFNVTLKNKTQIHNEIDCMRKDKKNGYINYLKLINEILDLNNIDEEFPKRHRKLDQLIWWRNR